VSQEGNPRRLFGIDRILAQHKGVILHCRTATRGIDHDSVKSSTDALSFPRIDVGPREGKCGCFLSEMMDERAAATATACHYNVATMAGQKADGRLVYVRRQDSLRAPLEQRDTHAAGALGRKNLWPIGRGAGRGSIWCESQQRHKPARQNSSERTGKNREAQC
jgi:hypothetical protein